MGDAQTTGRSATKRPSRARMVVAVLIAVVAVGLFAAAFVYADGMTYVNELLAQVSPSSPGQAAVPPAKPSVAASSTASATATKTADASASLPAVSPQMRSRLFFEQIGSQVAIEDLANGEFTAVTIDSVSTAPDSATLRVTATHRQLPTYQGTMVFERVDGLWLFKSLARDGASQVLPTHPDVDSSVVDAVLQQHVANQAVLKDLLAGGYKTLTVTSVQKGPNTATLQITMTGGTKPARKGDVLLISKSLGGDTYWFITAFR